MMLLTDYYRLERVGEQKSSHRIDCTCSTKSYPAFEAMRNKAGQLFMYFTKVPDKFSNHAQRNASRALTKEKNISSVYIPNPLFPLGYGDVAGTNDALLFEFNADYTVVDIYISRGQKANRNELYNLLANGELDTETSLLQQKAGNEPELTATGAKYKQTALDV